MDTSVQNVAYQVENRSWLLSPHGTEPGTTPTVTLDISKFTGSTHFPNGYMPSGVVLGKVTATGLLGPYTPGASDGTQTATHILFSSVRVTRQDGTNAAKVGGAGLVHGFVDPAKLPIASGTAGGLDSAGQTALKLIHFATGA
jgi:hypothetical protein